VLLEVQLIKRLGRGDVANDRDILNYHALLLQDKGIYHDHHRHHQPDKAQHGDTFSK